MSITPGALNEVIDAVVQQRKPINVILDSLGNQ